MSKKIKYVVFLQDLEVTRERACDLLKKAGCGHEPLWPGEFEVEKVRNDVEILVTAEHRVDSGVLKEWPKLKMVSLAFTGYDQVDRDYARSKEIKVYYVPGYATASVAELNLALTLSILRKIPEANLSIRKGEWHDRVYPGVELAKKIVGIVGTGTIGLKTARLFRAFGCSVIGWSRTPREKFVKIGGAYVSRKALFSESDIVVLCLALNASTLHIVGRAELESMKKGSVLINTARSELVEKKALLSVLARGDILAGIDVFEDGTEKRERDELFKFKNVIVTPHLGFKTKEALERLAEAAINNIGHFLDGNRENLLK